ncbi:MAG: hypothetical protein HY226_06440 [Candidatus Vogelbacteria bacterium]|nr:hypothetical protein [Candidatus Vogelbacteria bacterium]
MDFWNKNKKNIIRFTNAVLPLFLLLLVIWPNVTHAGLISWFTEKIGNIGSAIVSFPGKVFSAVIAAPLDALTKGFGALLYAGTVIIFVAIKGCYTLVSVFTNFIIQYSLTNKAISLNVIISVWQTTRDIANLSLIFILMYISIMTVLSLNGANTYKMLGKVILVGLLMNFSLSFTNIIIDATNIVALRFNDAIIGDKQGGVANSIGSALDVGNLMANTFNTAVAGDTSAPFNQALIVLGISVVLLIVTFVVMAGAGMFLIRVLKLMGVMISAPLAFAAIILPKTESYAKMWWEELIGNALLAPVFLFMVYISLNVIVATIPAGNVSLSQAVSSFIGGEPLESDRQQTTIVQTIFAFILGVGLLLSATAAAEKMSKTTAQSGGKLAGLAMGTAAGATAAAGRNTLGMASQFAYNSAYLKDKEAQGGTSGRIYGALRGVADYGRTATYDVREAPLAGAGISMLETQTGVKTGEGLDISGPGPLKYSSKVGAGAGGAQKTFEEGREYLRDLSGTRSRRAKDEAEKKNVEGEKRKVETENAKRNLQDKNRTSGISESRKNWQPKNPGDTDTRTDDEIKDSLIQKDLKMLNPDDIFELVGTDMEAENKQHIIRNLDKAQLEIVIDKKGITEPTKKATMSESNKTILKAKIMDQNNPNIEGKKYYAEEDKTKAEQEQLDNVMTEIDRHLNPANHNGVGPTKALDDYVHQDISDEVLLKLNINVIQDPRFAQHLSGPQLASIQKAGILKTSAQREAVKRAVESNVFGNASGNEYLTANAGQGLW